MLCEKKREKGAPRRSTLGMTNTGDPASHLHSRIYNEPLSEIPMTGLSLYRDALVRDPLLSSRGGAPLELNNAEAELRNLFDQISTASSNDPSGNLMREFLGLFESNNPSLVDRSELFRRWIQKFHGEVDFDRRFHLCPDLSRRIRALFCKLLNERKGMSSLEASSGHKRKSRTLSDMLTSLKGVAADPCDKKQVDREEWRDEILKARKALFLDVANMEHISSLKRQRTDKFLHATSSGTANFREKPQVQLCRRLGSSGLLNQPVRRSQRTLLKLNVSELPRNRIPIGPSFQADVPDWTGPPTDEYLHDNNELNGSRWLGTQLWPIDGDYGLSSEELVGKGRPNLCACTHPGSVECVRLHVDRARLRLKSSLGPAFFDFGFNEMGEEVSKSWTPEEQMRFDDFLRQNPSSEGKSFWEPALRYFTSKGRQGIVSFYFNVFVLRWMSIRTRLEAGIVDSDADEYL